MMAHKLYLLSVCLSLAVIQLSLSNHIDESLPLPSATITPDKTEIVTFAVDAEGNATTLEMTCTGVGDLMWFRGSPPVRLNDSYITELNDGGLMLTISPVTNNTDANVNGIPYYCVATNTLGTARSRTVLVKYAFFDGFEAENRTDEITVRLSQPVSFSCGVVAAAPPPSYIWYKDNQTVNFSDPLNTNKIRTLDNGATLVIYNLNDDDVNATYKCGVDNARMFDTEISTRLFKLITTTMFINTSFVQYRVPQSQIVANDVLPSNVEFFYIGATNGITRLFGSAIIDEDDSIFRATLQNSFNIANSGVTSLFLQLLLNDNQIGGSRVDFTLTVIEALTVISKPSDVTNIFHRFSNENINFTCNAVGTGTKLQWFYNAQKLSINSSSLFIDVLSVNDSGVYQCFWEESDDGMFASDTWALAVQQPAQPNSFVLTTTPQSVSTNRTIVPTGTLVSVTMEFIADSIPVVTWFRSDSEFNNITEINVNNSLSYNTTGVQVTNTQNIYTVTFTILSVNNITSGYYYSIINDSRTIPVKSPLWFVSEEVPLSITSVSLSPHNCLVDGVINQIQCIVNGLPDPTVNIERNSAIVVCDNGICKKTINVEGVVTTANLTFNNVSSAVEGVYLCVADNSAQEEIQEGLIVAQSDIIQYCTVPVISDKSPDSITRVADNDTTLTLFCRVESIPAIPTPLWYKDGVVVNDIPGRVDISTDGNLFELELIGIHENDTGIYVCSFNNTAIPMEVRGTVNLTVTPQEVTDDSNPLPVYVPISAAVGGALLLIVLIAIVVILLLCCCLISSNRNKKGSYATGTAMKDFTDGRGNVDKDSDEEDTTEQPEAFQPQYESLPAIRPTQPPEYKPSPAYNQFNPQSDDFDIIKQPLPENDNQTPFNYHPQQFFSGDNGGMAIHGSMMQGLQTQHPMGSSMGLQARFDDFMSDDEKFV